MLYSSSMRLKRKTQLKTLTSHPFFGFLILGFILMFIQIIRSFGVDLPNSVMRAFGLTMIYIIIGLGFSILLGYAGLASLGTAGFVGIGTYLIGYLTNQLQYSLITIIIISLLGAVLLGAIVGFISLRIEGMYLAIITLGLSEILNEIFKNASSITNGTNGLLMTSIRLFNQTFMLDNDKTYYYLIIVMIVMMVFTYNIIKSPTGRAMLAMKNSESAAQAMGVSILKYRLLAFIISTVFAIIGGLCYMSYITFSIPSTWNLAFSLNILAAVIVGGPRSIFGIVLGTFMIFGLNLALFQEIPLFVQNPALTLVFNGVLIVIVIMFYPGGLIRLVNTLKFKLVQLVKNLKLKWREYRYGKDS
jgi:branched-chain amino acid transport system permease protein